MAVSARTIERELNFLRKEGYITKEGKSNKGVWKVLKLDAIFRFLKDALPTGKTDEQNKRLVRRLLEEMQSDGMIKSVGRTWHEQL